MKTAVYAANGFDTVNKPKSCFTNLGDSNIEAFGDTIFCTIEALKSKAPPTASAKSSFRGFRLRD